jgi:hypothetical protein
VLIHDNLFIWNPPIDAPAVQMDHADFTGSRPNRFSGNVIYSTVPSMIHSSRALEFRRNTYWYVGERPPKWSYGSSEYAGFEAYRAAAGPEADESFTRPRLEALYGPLPAARPAPSGAPRPGKGKWLLLTLCDPRHPDCRSHVVFLQTALAQYGDGKLEAALALESAPSDLRYDWNLGAVRLLPASSALRRSLGVTDTAATLLISPAGDIVRQWAGFTAPAELGLALKRHLGPPPGSPALPPPPQ